MATRVRYEIDVTGPLATKDVKKTVRENMRAALLATVTEGQSIVRQQLTPGHGYLSGRLSSRIEASAKSRSGKPWALSAVVRSRVNDVMPGHKGYTTRIEARYHVFRNARAAMRRAMKLIRADYTKGLN